MVLELDSRSLCKLWDVQASHGHPSGEDRTTGSLSWVAQLQLYLRATQAGLSPAAASERKQLCDVVLENPNAAEAWLQFLQNEEALGIEVPNAGFSASASKRFTLLHWYHKATEMVQRSKGQAADAYLSIWLGFARQQWYADQALCRCPSGC